MMAAFAGSLAPAAEAAGFGWQGAALALPVLLVMGWGTVRLCACAAPGRGGGTLPRAALTLWGGLLLCRWLSRCGRRLEETGGGGPGTARWIVVILAVFLLWTACRRGPVLLRAAPLCAWLMLVTAGAVLLWGAGRVRWSHFALPAADLWGGFWAALEGGAGLLFVLPYIYGQSRSGRRERRGIVWMVFAAAAPVLLAGVTAGVLSPAVTALAEAPFYAMTASLGTSFRAEGLISCLWLVSDVVGLSLLARAGTEEGKRRPVFVIFLAAAAACLDFFAEVPGWVWGCGTVILWGVTGAALGKSRENCG